MDMSAAVSQLQRDLGAIFGERLLSVTVYGERPGHSHRADPHAPHSTHEQAPIRTLLIVDAISEHDLRACAGRTAAWHDAGLATPLVLASKEFERSLDAFPLEFGAILADHRVVSGRDPFEALTVDPRDIRRACEVQARSHLLHLREGYLETRGRADALSVLIVQSAPALTALLTSLARLETSTAANPDAAARHAERTLAVSPGAIADIVALASVQEISSQQAEGLFSPYLDAVERLVAYVDGWSAR